MTDLRILTIAHNHPSLHPGGTEIFAHDLFTELKRRGNTGLFLACTNAIHRQPKPGTVFQTLGRTADEVILWCGHFDRFFQSQVDLHGVVPELSRLLQAFRPDVVHLHHTLLLGVEMLFLIRRVLPDAAIVMTLHDYYGICANDGQMVTAGDHLLCRAASPDACHRCFPDRAPDRFLLREKHLKTHLGLVDAFLAPSRFLRDRYVAWGLDPARIRVVPNGRPFQPPAPHRTLVHGQRRNVFGYFGNFNPYKGVRVAARAVARLAALPVAPELTLHLHGGAPFQSDDFKDGLAADLAAAGRQVVAHGPYRRDDLPELMQRVDWVVMPSIWWENAPLVIQEAFQHRRPVICSGIGGMAEAVRDGIDGLHVRPNDPVDLAAGLLRAATEPGLWEKLVRNIPTVPTIADSADCHLALYRTLLTRDRAGRGAPRTRRAGA